MIERLLIVKFHKRVLIKDKESWLKLLRWNVLKYNTLIRAYKNTFILYEQKEIKYTYIFKEI